MLPFSFAKQHGVVVTEVDHERAKVTCRPDVAYPIWVELRRALGVPLEVTELDLVAFDELLGDFYEQRSEPRAVTEKLRRELVEVGSQPLLSATELLDRDDGAPVVALVHRLLEQAVSQGASDVHFESFRDRLLVRLRIDGVMREAATLSPTVAPNVLSRIKIMAGLDIAEKQIPQDGRMALTIAGRPIDIRVSTLKVGEAGERATLRILDQRRALLGLDELGMPPVILGAVDQLLGAVEPRVSAQGAFESGTGHPFGILLVTGPTGCGKTTTLYAALSRLNQAELNIMTVEDPIEYDLDGINQTPVNSKLGMSFSTGLRSVLRHDPDVIMVGEIRDYETAVTAIRASRTGHLVLSTLHTSSAVGAVGRLVDLGAESHALADTLIAVLSQRLVRRLCGACKRPAQTPNGAAGTSMAAELAAKPQPYEPVGCAECQGTGYSGRTGIFELLRVDEQLRELIRARAGEQALRDCARSVSASIHDDGLRLVAAGKTTLDELTRVLGPLPLSV